MRKKDYLEQLRKLLDVNLAKADADDAYAYYTELFDEEEFGTLVERIGTPEDVVHRLLDEEMEVSLYSARHSIRRGARLLGRMLSGGGKGCIIAVLGILLMAVVTLVSALAVVILAMRIGTYMKLGTLLMPYMLAYTAMMIALVIVVMMTLRHLPYLAAFIDEGRKRT